MLLHLTVAVLIKLYPNYKKPIFTMYVQSKNPFPELEIFIQQCKAYYNLDVITISADIKTALGCVLKDRPYLKACLMGTRRSDPFSQELSPFQVSTTNLCISCLRYLKIDTVLCCNDTNSFPILFVI